MPRKTKLMLQVEQSQGRPLEVLLPEMLKEHTLVETGKKLGVSTATVGYWRLKLGIDRKWSVG